MAVAKENKLVRGKDLYYVGQRIKENFVAKEDGKGLSTNDYTTEEKNKLAGVDTALAEKQDVLVSGENIKTLNGKSLLGEGNIDVGDEGAVRFVSQNLTNEQKAQARTNIEAYKKPASGIPASDIASDVIQGISNKQDTISDLSAIRSGAALGETSVQPVDIENMVEAEPIGSIIPPVNPSEFATKEELSQLQQGVNGFDGELPVSPNNTIDGYGIASNSGQITASSRANYSVRLYRMTFGKTYHITIPKISSQYTAAYGFLNESDASSPLYRVVTLPSPVPVGSLTNYEADVTAPSETLIYLVVCYETAYGVPTVTTSEHRDGLVGKVEDIDYTLNGGEVTETLSPFVRAEGYRITNQGRVTNDASSASSAIATYPVTPGNTCHIIVPTTKNKNNAVFAFANTGEIGIVEMTLPSPVVVGNEGRYEGDIVVPNNVSYLWVAFVFADGDPTVTMTGISGGLVNEVSDLSDRVDELAEEISDIESDVELSLPNRYVAVIGDTLQIFRRGVVKAANPYNYNVLFTCAKGRNYPRYWYVKVNDVAEVGTYPVTVTVTDNKGRTLAEGTTELVVVPNPVSPATAKKFVCFGASATAPGKWPAECFRRLTGSGGTPSGRGLSNIAFCGPMTKDGAGYFGVGGWSWASYISSGAPAFRFQVSGVGELYIGATYTNNGFTYTVREVNVTDGTGNILCATSSSSNVPTASGSLTKASGDGDTTIAFSSAAIDAANPFWDYANARLDFTNFADTYCGGNIDCMISLLGWNGLAPTYRTDFETMKGQVRTFIDAFHAQFPSGKFIILGINGPSPIGGMGANYGSNQALSDWYGMTVSALNLKLAYQEIANEDAYSDFVSFVDVAGQFDADYNLPYVVAPVNSRNSEATEMLGTNGVHPSDAGYFQIADAVYRSIVANFCQP